MGKIIKKILEWGKSKAINWLWDNIREYFNLSQLVFIMPVLAWIQDIPSFYWFPILVFTCALFPQAIKGFIFLSNYLQKSPLEITYHPEYNKNTRIFNRSRDCNEEWYMFIFSVKNISRNIQAKSVSIMIEGIDEGSNQLQYINNTYIVNTKNPIYSIDINAGLTAYFTLVIGSESQGKGKFVTLTASGKDTIPVVKKITL